MAGAVPATMAMRSIEDSHRGAARATVAGVGGLSAVAALASRGALPAPVRAALAGAGVGAVAAVGVDIALRRGDDPVLRPGDLLPDGEQLAPTEVRMQDGKLRFDSRIANTGSAPLQLALRVDEEGITRSTRQVIYNEDGSRRLVPIRGGLTMDRREDHQHLHFDDFVYFQLLRPGAGGAAPEQVAAGIKQSFFITDITRIDGTPQANVDAWTAVEAKLHERGESVTSGIDASVTQQVNVGWADVYPAAVQGQELPVGALEPGTYVLRQTFDPNDELIEMDERNNAIDVTIHVDETGAPHIGASTLVGPEAYRQRPDGRTVIPELVDAMTRTAADRPAR